MAPSPATSRPRRRRARVLGVAAALALAVGACGDDGEDTGPAITGGSPTDITLPPTPTTAPPDAAGAEGGTATTTAPDEG